MATTNFKRFDEALENILTDLEYLNNSTRYNGAQSGIYPASLHNKFAYQASAMASGLADMMVAKGYTVEDGSLGTTGHNHAALVAVLGNLVTQYDLSLLDLEYPDASLDDQTIVTATKSVADIETEHAGETFTMTFPQGAYTFRDDYTTLITTVVQLKAGAVIQPWYSVRNAEYAWVNTSGSEYRCNLADGTDPEIAEPYSVFANGVALTEGTLGALSAGQYAYSSGRLFVRLSDSTDPDTKATDYVTVGYSITFNKCNIPFLTQAFDLSGGGIVLPRNCGDYAPEWWGAKADGSTDCTSAFSSSFAAMLRNDLDVGAVNGNVLQLSAGSYLVSSPLTVLGCGVSVVGAGGDSSWIVASSAVGSNPVLTVASDQDVSGSTGWRPQEGFRLAHFGLVVNDEDTSGICIKQSYLYRGVLEHLNINVASAKQTANTASGIIDDGETSPGFSNGIHIRDCDIRGFLNGIRLTGRGGGACIKRTFIQGLKALSGSTAINVESTYLGQILAEKVYIESFDYGIKDYGGFFSIWRHIQFEGGSIATYDYDDNDSGNGNRQAYLENNSWSVTGTPLVNAGYATNWEDYYKHIKTGRYEDSGKIILDGGENTSGVIMNYSGDFSSSLRQYVSGDTDLFGQTYPLSAPFDFVVKSLNIETVQNCLNIGPTSTNSNMYTAIWAGDGYSGHRQMLRINGSYIHFPYSNPPANASASGKAGAITWDSGYIYVCISDDTWVRAALATWV